MTSLSVSRRALRRSRAIATVMLATMVGLSAPAIAQAPAGTVRYYHTDALGSIRAVTDAQGTVVARHDYFPFGDEPANAPDPCALRFPGQARDRESGMDYFGARYLANRAGRFTTADPGHVGGDIFDPQSWNAYAYARNNPLRFVDPTGREYEVHYGDGGVAYLTNEQFYSLFRDGVFFDGSLAFGGNIFINNDPYHAFGTFKYHYGFSDAVRDAGNSAAHRIKEGVMEMAVNAAGGALFGAARWGVEAAVAAAEARAGSMVAAAAAKRQVAGVLKMIRSGTTKGQPFHNRSIAGYPQLPLKPQGYYREYTVPLAGQQGRGAARIVTGNGGEVYFTADHYRTFVRIQ